MKDGPTPGQGGFGPAEPTPPPDDGAAYGYPGPQGGYGYPAGAGPMGPAGQMGVPGHDGGYAQPLVVIGDITVTADGIVTPAGKMPLSGATWTVTDMSRTEERIPTHAIVLAVVFVFFCFLGLLFLLMKERTTAGHVQVTVNSGGKFHSTMIPVHDPMAVHHIMQQVNYARSVSV
ncbi:hypothetical protein [Streptomyces marispadix]|uniref:Uncharacterized protein n=1 Tax=Streptomyces marispadix TaxID=2922868 RepID=A0ABS9T0U9_9ACTN|nr:hypothetical protein [Streptomyces marispadix]MCH6162161.1 hypothetical protein [Streptomyces marispadix]